MKKYLFSALAVVALLSVSSVFINAGTEDWMDMENCAICKHLAADQEMMTNISWELYATKSGMVSVTTINDGYAERFETAHANMKATVDKMMAGEEMDVCNMCMGMGSLFQKGATSETFKTRKGEICITSSDNAEVVTEMHVWVERTEAGMKKMHEGIKDDGSHEGHSH